MALLVNSLDCFLKYNPKFKIIIEMPMQLCCHFFYTVPITNAAKDVTINTRLKIKYPLDFLYKSFAIPDENSGCKSKKTTTF